MEMLQSKSNGLIMSSPKYVQVFAYGSLMNPSSLARSLMRPVPSGEIKQVEINGFQRVWNSGHLVYSDVERKVITGVFLNLTMYSGAFVNGVLIQVDSSELSRLVARERGYDLFKIPRANVSVDICEKTQVFTFIDNRPPPAPDGLIPAAYVNKVLAGCVIFGDKFVSRFAETTAEPAYRKFPGSYRFIDPEQSSLT
jgi:cation transport regulator ChaC